ncbi:Similar to hypothetical protein NCU02247 [Neurospora crassa OR74A]; acc. no. XP_959891 [Pyronema omphalodes CBS 100304]|uniref:Uncharacterized protein n=1 Tax=Pyronema omphalodes (strain CBS 100304) TaxID=1076935 RepID=U4LEN3_PYROM|nr:Similar to hypothetical protein NCU02247 [Neurospora crassa OR74A]; acc. no. XP_959891 [Pyronema omphalodes CBS 100304]
MIWDFYFDSGPLHTYRANMDDVSDTKLYLGSVKTKGIPRPVEVDVISANSPCQGFSADLRRSILGYTRGVWRIASRRMFWSRRESFRGKGRRGKRPRCRNWSRWSGMMTPRKCLWLSMGMSGMRR